VSTCASYTFLVGYTDIGLFSHVNRFDIASVTDRVGGDSLDPATDMAQEIYSGIGAAIRKRRETIGMTQAALAEKAGLSRTSVTNVERGGQALLVHQLLLIADALHVRAIDLLPASIPPESTSIPPESTKERKAVTKEIKALMERLEDGTSGRRTR
jgi:transcriptional regulator with XRE-family HTH domain